MRCITLTKRQRTLAFVALGLRARALCVDARRKDPKTLSDDERARQQIAVDLMDVADLLKAADQVDLWIEER